MIYPTKTEHLISNWDTDKIPVFKINCILILIIIRFYLIGKRKRKSSASLMISSVLHYTPAYSLLKSFFFFFLRIQSTFLFWGVSPVNLLFFRSISFILKKIFFKLWHLKRKIFTFEGNYTVPPKLYHLLYLPP